MTLYTLTVEPRVRIPAGNLFLSVGGQRTFYFFSLDERQKVLDWVREKGWVHSTGVDHVMSSDEARKEILADIERTCDHFHHPVPSDLRWWDAANHSFPSKTATDKEG